MQQFIDEISGRWKIINWATGHGWIWVKNSLGMQSSRPIQITLLLEEVCADSLKSALEQWLMKLCIFITLNMVHLSPKTWSHNYNVRSQWIKLENCSYHIVHTYVIILQNYCCSSASLYRDHSEEMGIFWSQMVSLSFVYIGSTCRNVQHRLQKDFPDSWF